MLSAAGHVGLSPGWGTEKELCTKSDLGLCLRPFPCVYEQVVGLQAERPQTEWKDFKEGTRTQRAVIVFPKVMIKFPETFLFGCLHMACILNNCRLKWGGMCQEPSDKL